MRQLNEILNIIKQNKTMNLTQSFTFRAKPYSFSTLMRARTLKVYWERDKSERKLIVDEFGRLFHYSYEEEMSFDDSPDRQDYLWVLVENEEDSDNLTSQSGLSLLRSPFVAASETDWFNIEN